MGMSSGSGTMLKPLGFMARIDKLGMRAITITKSFFMFFFMIKMVFRLTLKITDLWWFEQGFWALFYVKKQPICRSRTDGIGDHCGEA